MCSHIIKKKPSKILNNSKECLKNFLNDTFDTLLIILLIICIVTTLALGLRLKQGFAKGCGPRGSLGVAFHAVGSVGENEGMNLHTPKLES